ncbi:endonuclease/exonuclease/phosphatase family protein [Laspinema olomoucense]|uniref:Endonuclease/exonuclease/phosphatase family protein n=1 Tax=Laspinema olomoucense D3b TaxID=2953688 RepID=A0ABT2N1P8_9CYAN|nr:MULTISPECIES: endonuclease/exonuclease/phosphatase family protein [unclassified Laspinema]MCT7972775.1 endonuclease/exonuclease/phosphatase family protein [Laspinema sp. D3d]MCT7976613.1 endonuclease/exonuclease/phosphatase family protein [Laspinema sp. D3b]MCT7990139.1 endonuclease/exonuclease/phosphatase family protein [Laspinema sp. D3a]MCT7996755.1 endonuclease/exonuclease/phosphatase family protein [Laspinema sp. D3c]
MDNQFPFSGLISPNRFIPVQETVLSQDNFSDSAIAGKSIKILNWNVAKNNNTSKWANDFYHLVERHQPDLICFQEIELNKNTQKILALESMGWRFAPNFIDAYYQTYCGILTASKVQPVSSRAILTPEFEPLTNTPKVSLVAEYPLKKTEQTLLVVNTHAINFVNLNKFKSQLQKLESVLGDRREPLIMCGDFNTWSQLRFDLLKLMAKRLHLISVHFSPEEQAKLKTFLGSPPLDHIFYRGLTPKPQTAKVLDKLYSSDHKPMVVELALVV